AGETGGCSCGMHRSAGRSWAFTPLLWLVAVRRRRASRAPARRSAASATPRFRLGRSRLFLRRGLRSGSFFLGEFLRSGLLRRLGPSAAADKRRYRQPVARSEEVIRSEGECARQFVGIGEEDLRRAVVVAEAQLVDGREWAASIEITPLGHVF